MNFSNLKKETKLEVYNKVLMSREQAILEKILESGLDPDDFDPDSFLGSFEEIDESIDTYSNLLILKLHTEVYVNIKNKINQLENE